MSVIVRANTYTHTYVLHAATFAAIGEEALGGMHLVPDFSKGNGNVQ